MEIFEPYSITVQKSHGRVIYNSWDYDFVNLMKMSTRNCTILINIRGMVAH